MTALQTTEAERRAGLSLWRRVGDAGFAPSAEERGFMASVSFTPDQLITLLKTLHPATEALAWDRGWEALALAQADDVQAVASRWGELELRTRLELRWCFARHGLLDVTDDAGLRAAAVGWLCSEAPGPAEDEEGSSAAGGEVWWPGAETIWTEAAYWQAAVAMLRDLSRATTDSPRIRAAWDHAQGADQATVLLRTFSGSPAWALIRASELDDAGRTKLEDYAQAVFAGELHAVSSRPVDSSRARALARDLSVAVVALSHAEGLQDPVVDDAVVLRALLPLALSTNTAPTAVAALNRALSRLPLDEREAVLMDAPFLRWRHVHTAPTDSVVTWAVGAVRTMTKHSHADLLAGDETARLHLGDSLTELGQLASAALGELGPVALPALIDAVGRGNPLLTVVACRALAEHRAVEAVPALVGALLGGTDAVQEAAVAGLIPLGDVVLPSIAPLLTHSDAAVRSSGVRVLAAMQPTSDVRGLANRCLVDERRSDLRRALQAVAFAPDVPAAETALRDQLDALPATRWAAVEADLEDTDGAAWAEHQALGVLCLAATARWFARAAAERGAEAPVEHVLDALHALGDDPLTPWALAWASDVPGVAARWLAPLTPLVGAGLAAPLVWRLASSAPAEARGARPADPDALSEDLPRLTWLGWLVQAAPQHGVPAFERVLQHSPSAEERALACEGLRAAGAAGLEATWGLLEDEGTAPDAARVLEQVGDPRSVTALRRALDRAPTASTTWELTRALVVSQATPDIHGQLPRISTSDDRQLDAILGGLGSGGVPAPIDGTRLPRMNWASGAAVSDGARTWLVRTLLQLGRGADWLVPMWVPAVFLAALRSRIAAPSRRALLDALEEQARNVEGARGWAAVLVAAQAFSWTEADVDRHAAKMSEALGRPPGRAEGRLAFANGDPRAVFLHGSRAAMRWTVRWSDGCADPVVTGWARQCLERVAAAVSLSPERVRRLVESQGDGADRQAIVDQVRGDARRGETWAVRDFLGRVRDTAWAEVLGTLVWESQSAGQDPRTFIWQGSHAVDVEGLPVVLGDSVSVADASGWPAALRARWQQRIGRRQAFSQLAAAADGGTDVVLPSTGWLPTKTLLSRLGEQGYALRMPAASVRGGTRDFPPAPPVRAMRALPGGWSLVLELSGFDTWTSERVAPVTSAVTANEIWLADPLAALGGSGGGANRTHGAWVPVEHGRAASEVLSALAEDMAALTEGSAPQAMLEEVAETRALSAPEVVRQDEPELLVEREEHEVAAARRARARTRSAPKPGFFARLFGSSRRQAAAREAEKQRRREARAAKLAEIRSRRKQAEAAAREAQRAAVLQERADAAAASARAADAETKLGAARWASANRGRYRRDAERVLTWAPRVVATRWYADRSSHGQGLLQTRWGAPAALGATAAPSLPTVDLGGRDERPPAYARPPKPLRQPPAPTDHVAQGAQRHASVPALPAAPAVAVSAAPVMPEPAPVPAPQDDDVAAVAPLSAPAPVSEADAEAMRAEAALQHAIAHARREAEEAVGAVRQSAMTQRAQAVSAAQEALQIELAALERGAVEAEAVNEAAEALHEAAEAAETVEAVQDAAEPAPVAAAPSTWIDEGPVEEEVPHASDEAAEPEPTPAEPASSQPTAAEPAVQEEVPEEIGIDALQPLPASPEITPQIAAAVQALATSDDALFDDVEPEPLHDMDDAAAPRHPVIGTEGEEEKTEVTASLQTFDFYDDGNEVEVTIPGFRLEDLTAGGGDDVAETLVAAAASLPDTDYPTDVGEDEGEAELAALPELDLMDLEELDVAALEPLPPEPLDERPTDPGLPEAARSAEAATSVPPDDASGAGAGLPSVEAPPAAPTEQKTGWTGWWSRLRGTPSPTSAGAAMARLRETSPPDDTPTQVPEDGDEDDGPPTQVS